MAKHHDSRGRSKGPWLKNHPPLSNRQRKRLDPPRGQPWAQIWVDELESEARAGLSINARRALDVLVCRHVRSHQADNGALQVSYETFERAGVGRNYVSAALRELPAAGFVRVSGQAAPTNPWMKRPTLYELPTYQRQEGGLVKDAKRQFVWIPLDVLESAAWRRLSINARRIMDRLLLENFRHFYVENGRLRVSFRQFADCGVAMRFAASGIAELVDAGMIAVTKGVASGSLDAPHLYRITFHGTLDAAPTWRNRQKEMQAVPEEKLFSHPLKVKRAHPPKVKRGTSFHTPQRCSEEAEITPPEGEASIISSGVGGRENVSTVPSLHPHDATPAHPAALFYTFSPMPGRFAIAGRVVVGEPSATPRSMRVEAYAMAHANWIRRYGIPIHDEVAVLRACYAVPTTTTAEWAVISAYFSEAIRERKAVERAAA
jgi:hypothetical protein